MTAQRGAALLVWSVFWIVVGALVIIWSLP